MGNRLNTIDLAQKKLTLLQQKIALQKLLPHLYGWKFYPWARSYFESINQQCFLCAANQISKSSSQIRKNIHWATETDLWPKLWRTAPQQFWYLYPTRDVAHIEFTKKWVPEFLPRGDMKTDKKYGWTAEYSNKRIWAIHFNSGVTLFYKTYKQDVQDLQTGSVHFMSLDEETPEELMGELSLRLAATEGYMSAVFTPTIGQEYWRLIMEERGPYEKFPDAFKLQVSMYDCQRYEDGSISQWTNEKIKRQEMACRSPQEVEMRINGRFVVAEGLKYSSFYKKRNVIEGHPLPKDWSYWCGVDTGSGGSNHKAAITVIAVSPDHTKGRVFRGYRGSDDVETTTIDTVRKCIQLTKDLSNCRIFYDHANRDFYLMAQELGLNVEKAEKSHEIGEQTLNVLFKNQMLQIYDYTELHPLIKELTSLKKDEPKRSAKDDAIDSLRYAAANVPWNFSVLSDLLMKSDTDSDKTNTKIRRRGDDRRKFYEGDKEDGLITIEEELQEWNELMLGDDYYDSF